MNDTGSLFVEVGFRQVRKKQQGSPGDVFLSERSQDERIICILADGLGSGIKANVLATLTATMAMNYIKNNIDIKRAAEIIMKTLPVCSERKIGYSTFTIVDIDPIGRTRMIEYDNPPALLLRGTAPESIERKFFDIETETLGKRELAYSEFGVQTGDTLVFYSDGVTQSGMGKPLTPLGWSDSEAEAFVENAVKEEIAISARALARKIVAGALKNDGQAEDDISCAVIRFRNPRRTLVVTGPPFRKENDELLAEKFTEFEGTRIISGGTTANIIARCLGKEVKMELSGTLAVPPASRLEGAALVTEGTITLSRTLELLKGRADLELMQQDPAVKLAEMLIESDQIHFIVGTRINEAHQDPNLPESLDIRRNLMRDMVKTLNEIYMKYSTMELI
ncbi:MAG: SpoIIE family protein phosphatase [Phycisphaerae bacterium]